MSEVTWVEVTIIHETDMAVLISQDPESEETNMAKWIPKSQISDSTDDMNIGAEIEIEIPVWLAEKKGLV
ncbi:hypothetical protein LCGC14_0865600 [marine sediment metagenome]|uniref:Uncharacterized protein n=1 Tax=marine sediment metagenome TaxID=412755 RepID=A0A0F9P662_9ZZZZ